MYIHVPPKTWADDGWKPFVKLGSWVRVPAVALDSDFEARRTFGLRALPVPGRKSERYGNSDRKHSSI